MSNKKNGFKSDVHLNPVKSIPETTRLKFHKLLSKTDIKTLKKRDPLSLQLYQLKQEHDKNLKKLLGGKNITTLKALKKDLSNASSSKKDREFKKMVDLLGLSPDKIGRLKVKFSDAALKLQKKYDLQGNILPGVVSKWLSPWVTYEAPYAGGDISFAWNISDGAKKPTLSWNLELDGHVGSKIDAWVDDDGDLDIECYTKLSVWHTVLSPGPLECYFAFEFNRSTFSGETHDEFYFSHAPIQQGAFVTCDVFNSGALAESQFSKIFRVLRFDYGDDATWNDYVANPGDLHWYYFKTNASFEAGIQLLIQAGIRHYAHIWSDNVSVKTSADIDMRLTKVMVRSVL